LGKEREIKFLVDIVAVNSRMLFGCVVQGFYELGDFGDDISTEFIGGNFTVILNPYKERGTHVQAFGA